MPRHGFWVLPLRAVPRVLPAMVVRSKVWKRLSRRRAWLVSVPTNPAAGPAKGIIMASDTEHPLVYAPGQTALAQAGQQYVETRPPDPDEQREENQERHYTAHPEVCLEESTRFYSKVTPAIDRYVPSYLEAQPLNVSVGARRNDGTFPPWVTEGDPSKTPCEQYVEWFNYIWNTGDPSQWGPTVFTNNCVNIDPSGMTTGAEESAANFVMLFKYFPELRGEVVSWGVNDRELFINWRFRIPNNVKGRLPVGPVTQVLQEQQGGRDFLVPVIDKFCFVDGRVSFRVAYFDVITLVGYLSENFSANQLYDYLISWTSKALTSGGIPFLPKMLLNLFLGLFVWPPPPRPTGLAAFPADGAVTLTWPEVDGAESYRLCRANALEGPYDPLPLGVDAAEQRIYGTTYTDREVENGTPYWYTISPIMNTKPGGQRRASIMDSLNIAEARRSRY